MAKKKDVAGDGAYVSERVRIVYGELVDSLAHVAVLAEQSSELLKNRFAELKSECANMPAERLLEEFAFTQATLEIQHISFEHLKAALVKTSQALGLLNVVGQHAIDKERSDRGKLAAEIKDRKPGGNKSKREEIQSIWATGKYKTRIRCAEEEYEAVGLSLSTAIKALRNTPDPSDQSIK
jgi:hypothetical protein